MKLARVSIALAAALFCAHAVAGQESRDSKEAPTRNAAGLPHFESAVLSGSQTKPSAYRRVSNAKDPEAPVSVKEGRTGIKPGEPPRRRAADKSKGG